MITNPTQLEGAFQQILTARRALEGIRMYLADANPVLYSLTAEGYVRRIEELQAEIDTYLRDHPSADRPDLAEAMLPAR